MIRSTQLLQLLIHERASELIPFLQSLSADDQLTLAPYLRTFNQDYLAYGDSACSRSRRATLTQARMLGLASLVCLDRSEFEQTNLSHEVLTESVLESVLPWHCPGWFSEYINDYAASHYLPVHFSYEYLLRMMQKGWVRPREETVVQFLPQLLYELHDHRWVYCPENLTRNAITLEEHLWYLFRYETNLNWSDQHLRYGERAASETDWKCTLRLLAEGGKLARRRLLSETLAAISRPFNPSLHQWFVELLDYLEPTPEELLAAATQPVPASSSSAVRSGNCRSIATRSVVTRSIAEVCRELFAAPAATPTEETTPARRERRSLPDRVLPTRPPQPYPRETIRTVS